MSGREEYRQSLFFSSHPYPVINVDGNHIDAAESTKLIPLLKEPVPVSCIRGRPRPLIYNILNGDLAFCDPS